MNFCFSCFMALFLVCFWVCSLFVSEYVPCFSIAFGFVYCLSSLFIVYFWLCIVWSCLFIVFSCLFVVCTIVYCLSLFVYCLHHRLLFVPVCCLLVYCSWHINNSNNSNGNNNNNDNKNIAKLWWPWKVCLSKKSTLPISQAAYGLVLGVCMGARTGPLSFVDT